jgi:Flp pilus assembly protein TadG
MLRIKTFKQDETGATLVEYAIGASVVIMAIFGVLEFGRALWAHNALSDAARRGARYAVLHPKNDPGVKNVVVYDDPDGGTQPLLPEMTTANVVVTYSDNFSVNSGTATVTIDKYDFKFVLPFLPTKITMPASSTTLTGESAGVLP